MRYGLTERLLGAMVLLTLAIIFLPWVLKEDKRMPETSEESEEIVLPSTSLSELNTEAPEDLSALPVPETAPLNQLQEVTLEQKNQQNPELHSGPDPEQNFAMPETGVPAWVIQVASFAEEANARRLVERLRQEQHQAYWQQRNSLAVVFTGPYTNQDLARSAQDQLLQQEGLKTLLTRYKPETRY